LAGGVTIVQDFNGAWAQTSAAYIADNISGRTGTSCRRPSPDLAPMAGPKPRPSTGTGTRSGPSSSAIRTRPPPRPSISTPSGTSCPPISCESAARPPPTMNSTASGN
jgi:hypothetical protein